LILGVFLLLDNPAAAQVKPFRHILIFHEVGAYAPLADYVDRGIRTSLDSSPYRIEFYREFMQTGLFPDSAEQQRIHDFYVKKYQNHRPDLIITVGPDPLEFMIETHRKAFPGVPVVFCQPDRIPGGFPVDSDFTGVAGDIAPAETLAAALRLRPGTKHVVVIVGIGALDLDRKAFIKNQLKNYEDRLDISYFTGLVEPDLVERLKHLPSDTIILLHSLGVDVAGNLYTTAESGAIVAANANAPVFTLIDRSLNHGEVGGDVSDAVEQGRIAGTLALRILNGEKPQNIAVVKNVDTYMFDWRALKRWGMKESDLPAGSVVLNRPPSLWQLYKRYVLVGIFVILTQTLIIAALLRQRAKRKKIETELVRSNEKLRLSMESGEFVGWEADIQTGRGYWFGDLRHMFGISSNAFATKMEDFYLYVHPEDRQRVSEAVAAARQSRAPFCEEFRVVHPDGAIRWIVSRGKFEYAKNGDAMRMIGMAVDITKHKQAEEALASLSHKLIEAQEEERTRIARELHDDINQRIVLLALNLEELRQGVPVSQVQTRHNLEEACGNVGNLATDIQALSHRLHSSKLDVLGLAAACHGFCQELSDRQNVEIAFHSEGIPKHLPQETSICLFRVLQEALQNALKHSGARQFEVTLKGTSNEIHLRVRDGGVGFDPEKAMNQPGIGLVSMQERMKLVDGQLSIDSKVGRGTTVHARVPFLSPSENHAKTVERKSVARGAG
jgi:PAS domain S-box-containing protein